MSVSGYWIYKNIWSLLTSFIGLTSNVYLITSSSTFSNLKQSLFNSTRPKFYLMRLQRLTDRKCQCVCNVHSIRGGLSTTCPGIFYHMIVQFQGIVQSSGSKHQYMLVRGQPCIQFPFNVHSMCN